MDDNELREALAAVSHEIWAHWMKYLFAVGDTDVMDDYVIPRDYVHNWKRQILTPYTDLTEREKDSDREQADKILEVLRKARVIDR